MMQLTRSTLAGFLAFGSAIAMKAQQIPDRPIVETDLGMRIDRYLSTLEVYGMSGSILVEREGRVLVHRSYGLADRGTKTPLRVDMPLLIGSLSKQFVAAAILKLESQGRLSVHDSLPTFFADVPADKRSITLHQLLTHTAGTEYLPSGDLFAPMERAAVMRAMLATPLRGAVGGPHAYSNTGYTLLSGVIESVTGMRYEDYIRREIFTAAGMTGTGFETDTAAEWRTRLAVHSYTGSTDEGPAAGFPVAPVLMGAGGVVSTVADLFRWELALRGSAILPDSSRAKLFTPYVEAGGPTRYAYGWNVVTTPRKTTMMMHAGDIGGYNADFRRYIDEGLTVIFLSNARVAGGGYRQAVMNNVSLLVAGVKYAAPPNVVNLDTTELAAFAGRYRLPAGDEIRLWIDDGRLMIGADGQTGIGLIGAASSEDSTAANSYNERTLALARGIVNGDFRPLGEVLTPSLPFEAVRGEIGNLMRMYTDSLGIPGEPEILGTAVLSPSAARTYWRLRFERGSVLQEWGWQGQTLVALDGGMTTAMATMLAPLTSSEAASFDPFTGRGIAVGLGVEGGRSISIRAGERHVTAIRVGDL